jgi:hypothetical protein
MAVAAKETGQIELSDGDEAIAFWRTGNSGDEAGRIPLESLSEGRSHRGTSGVATQ